MQSFRDLVNFRGPPCGDVTPETDATAAHDGATHQNRRMGCAQRYPSGVLQALPAFGMNLSATPLLHQRLPVGGGPSSKT